LNSPMRRLFPKHLITGDRFVILSLALKGEPRALALKKERKVKEWVNIAVAVISVVLVSVGAYGCAKHDVVTVVDVALVFLGSLIAIVGVALNKNGNGHNGGGTTPR